MIDMKQHWEQIYQDKSPLEVSWYQKDPTMSLNLIRHSGTRRDDYIIDVGGGASLLVDRLRDAGYSRLAVLDISARALELAQLRLGKTANRIEWHVADITRFQPGHRYALWHDRAVFHFLTSARDRRNYVDTLKRSLLPAGQIILAAFAIGGPEKCSGLEIVQYDYDKLSRELGDGFRLLEEASETHQTPSGKLQQFSYFRFTGS